MEGFTKKQAAVIAGIKPSSISYYVDQGYLKPDIDDAKGRGKNRKYSYRNLVQCLLIHELIESGVTLKDGNVQNVMGGIDLVCNNAPQEVAPGSLGFDVLDIDDPLAEKRFSFLLVYSDCGFAIRWVENEADTEKINADMRQCKRAHIISISPLLSKIRNHKRMVLETIEHNKHCREINKKEGEEAAVRYHLNYLEKKRKEKEK